MAERDARRDLEICEKALPPPWRMAGKRFFCADFPLHAVMARWPNGELDDFIFCKREEDAQFVTTAREALPYWIKRAQELEAELAKLRTQLEDAHLYILQMEIGARGEGTE